MEEISAFSVYSLKKSSKDKKNKQKSVNKQSSKKNKKPIESLLDDMLEFTQMKQIGSSDCTSDEQENVRRSQKNKKTLEHPKSKRPPKRNNENKVMRNYSSDETLEDDVKPKKDIKGTDTTIKRSKRLLKGNKRLGDGNRSTKRNGISSDAEVENEQDSDMNSNKKNRRSVKRNSVDDAFENLCDDNLDIASDDAVELVQPPKKKKSKKNKTLSSNETTSINNNLSFTLQQMKLNNKAERMPTNDDDDEHENSVEVGRKLFNWIITPVEERKFFKYNWERQPIQVVRHYPSYYKCLLSTEHIDRVVREKNLYFGKNIDVTSYTNGLRETHNPPGRATAPVLWDYYNNGCSIRILNPQTFFKKIHCLNAKLQEFFGCFVGANVYLTPPGKQGFAPHYDDIEAFVLQIEGKKQWKVYSPRCDEEILPRESSPNFSEHELGEVLMDVMLEEGDLLYFPRGFIHQAHSVEDSHSLHITLSVFQKNSWADLLEKLIPAALKTAIETDPDYRRGLSLNYLHHMGLVQSDVLSMERARFVSQLQQLIQKLFNYAPIDAAVDQMAKQFQIDALPPYIEKTEINRTVFGDGESIKNGIVLNKAEIDGDTKIKLLRLNILRLIKEDDTLRIYHSVNNSREYHGEEPQFLEISETEAPAIEALIKNYPRYIAVEELPLDDMESKVQIASDLWEVGLLKTKETLGADHLKYKSILKN